MSDGEGRTKGYGIGGNKLQYHCRKCLGSEVGGVIQHQPRCEKKGEGNFSIQSNLIWKSTSIHETNPKKMKSTTKTIGTPVSAAFIYDKNFAKQIPQFLISLFTQPFRCHRSDRVLFRLNRQFILNFHFRLVLKMHFKNDELLSSNSWNCLE